MRKWQRGGIDRLPFLPDSRVCLDIILLAITFLFRVQSASDYISVPSLQHCSNAVMMAFMEAVLEACPAPGSFSFSVLLDLHGCQICARMDA